MNASLLVDLVFRTSVIGHKMRKAFLPLRNALPREVSWSGSDEIRMPIAYIRTIGELDTLVA